MMIFHTMNQNRTTKEKNKEGIPSDDCDDDDFILYDCTPFTAGVPINQEFSQNFDFAGYVPLCQETYETLKSLNPRLSFDMPFPGFLHSMNSLLQTAIVDSVGQQCAQNILPAEYVIPGPIYEYLSNISPIMTPGNQEIKPNIPDQIIPQVKDEDAHLPAGTFGVPDAKNHNVYECQLCPYTTMQYVKLSAQPKPPAIWTPLPALVIPQGGTATTNFLGYFPVLPVLHTEEKEALRVGHFEETDNIKGRICYNASLFTKCNMELTKLSEKFKMEKLGCVNGVRKYIRFKSDPGNLIFCETLDPTPPMFSCMTRLLSSYSYGVNAAGSAGIQAMHRRRTESSPGCCFTFNGEPAQEWVETRNALFEMQEPFAPVHGIDLPQIRDKLYKTEEVEGVRTTIINDWIRKNFLKKI